VVDHFHLVRGATPRLTASDATANASARPGGRRESANKLIVTAGSPSSTAPAISCSKRQSASPSATAAGCVRCSNATRSSPRRGVSRRGSAGSTALETATMPNGGSLSS
jgi:hypothetical protein